LVRISFSMLE